MKIKNSVSNVIEYKSVPDLWHLAMELKERGQEDLGDDVLTTWHMAHTLLQVNEGVSVILED
jgi:hypothetical protein|tara:strand:+ start:1770 stop:1955 length:186 start_codon:yes stop_codon:yes gene_type:complete